MAHSFTRIGGASLLGVAAISLFISQASAAESAEPYQSFVSKDCGNVSTCFVEFPTIPNKNDVVITSIACLVTALDQASRMVFATATVFGKNGNELGQDTLIPAYTDTAPIGAFHAINTETTLVLRGGSKVELTLSASKIASTIADCKIAGHIAR